MGKVSSGKWTRGGAFGTQKKNRRSKRQHVMNLEKGASRDSSLEKKVHFQRGRGGGDRRALPNQERSGEVSKKLPQRAEVRENNVSFERVFNNIFY